MARSTRRDDRPGPESEGGRVVLALVLGLALLVGAGYVAAYAAAGDKVPRGTVVGGVDIGGHSPTVAEQVLRIGLSDRVDAPFTVVVNGRAQQVTPSQVGLAVDYAASVRQAGAARSWRPSRLFGYFTNGSTYRPVVTLDQDRLAELVQRLDASDGRTPTDGGIVFRNQTFTVRPPRPGLTLDPRVAGTAFWNAYLSDDHSVQLRLSPVAPAIDTATIDRFVKRFANPAMAASVELRFAGTSLRLSPASYGDLLAARHVGDQLVPVVRAQALARLTDAELAGAPIPRPTAATVALVDGRPQVVKARPGVGFAARDVARALLRAIASRQRTAQVRPTRVKASFTNADARRLGIRQQVASYTVRTPRDPALAADVRRLDGTVLHPGDTFSLRGLLGGSTPAGPGGDALATAMFNAAWLGGLRITAHAAHTSYAGTSPPGRDATLHSGHDLAFVDDTGYGVLVSAVERHGSLTVTLWSRPRWTVTSDQAARTHVVPAGRHVSRADGCVSRDGRDGFDVTVTRSFARGGDVDHTSSYTVTYAPRTAVVCKAPRHLQTR